MTFSMTTDYSKNEEQSFEPLPTNSYEALIENVQERATENGAESLQIKLRIRNDLDAALPGTNGKYHNRVVFMDNWKRKATNQYDMQGLQYVLEAAQIPEGTVINSLDDFARALTLKPVKVYIKKTTNTYKGQTKDINQIAPWNFSKTDFPQVNHQWKDAPDASPSSSPVQSGGQPINIDPEDLPF